MIVLLFLLGRFWFSDKHGPALIPRGLTN